MQNMSGMMSIVGSKFNNVIQEIGKSVSIKGWAGDDVLSIENSAGMSELWGGRGDDVLSGSVPGAGQIHMGGGLGNDHIIMDLTNESGVQGHHVYGGKGADKFEFTNVAEANSPVIGRIDDFNHSEDSIWIEGNEIDLFNLPDGVDLVSYQEQLFLKIGDNVVYALEGAKDGGLERHFLDFPTAVDQLEVVEFEPHVNFVPFELFEDEVADLNALYTSFAGTVDTTDGDDWIYDSNVTHLNADGEIIKQADAEIDAGKGNDVVEAGKGHDQVWGGDGHDLIAGGQDDDLLFGGNGNDKVWGGTENDKIWGNAGNDELHGGHGTDRLGGGTGNDTLYGDAGNDTLLGGGGSDFLSGGAGADLLNGGHGDDVFDLGDGDLVSWRDLSGGVVDRMKQLDEIQDFKLGSDTISFEGNSDVESVDDLMAWKVYQDENVKFMLSIPDTGERVLVDVDDDTDWKDFMMDEANFDF